MEVIKLFEDSLKYPTKDFNKLLILGVLFIISGIFNILVNFGLSVSSYIGVQAVGIVSGLITLIITLIVAGYGLSITRRTINREESIPEFEWVKNLIDGIKIFFLSIVYYIIPFIVTLIVAYATGAFNYLIQIINYSMLYGSASIPQSILSGALASFLIVLLIGAILFIIFSLLLNIAIARLAETDSLVAAINMKDIFNKIGEIGWGNYIIWIVLYLIINLVIGLIVGIVQIIPFIGIIIALLVFSPYIQMFSSRALGLIYNESKNN